MSTEATDAGLAPEVATHLSRRILSVADSKRLMGIRYSDWLLGAPSIEAGIAASSMCQDEWGHARLIYAMLKDFGQSPTEVEHERPATDYASVDPLDEMFPDWAAVVAAIVLIDGGLTTALAALAAGRYEQASSRIPKMLAEEEFHADFGAAWFKRLSLTEGEGAERLLVASRRFLPRVLAWIAPEDAGYGALVETGVVEDPGRTRRRFEEAVAPLMRPLAIDVGSVEADRSGWDTARGRGPGHPDSESVERARGDLNRGLLVE